MAELAALPLRPRIVFVVENLESVPMEAAPDAVVVHGSGYAVGKLGDIPWIRDARIIYRGDIDSHGFLILHRIRSRCPDVTSVLMDTDTLDSYRDLWASEPDPTAAVVNNLTLSQTAALEAIPVHGHVRMDQERIRWSAAMAVLRAAAESRGAHVTRGEVPILHRSRCDPVGVIKHVRCGTRLGTAPHMDGSQISTPIIDQRRLFLPVAPR